MEVSRKRIPELAEQKIREAVEGNFKELNLSYMGLTEFPDSIIELQNLTMLDLSGNQLTDIPESITRLVNLTKLYLYNNKLTDIPESITRLVNLTKLDLDGNQLTDIPESITRLVNLTTLDLSRNQLTDIPESITRLVNLTALYLSENQLTDIPESITRLVNLTTLDLDGNQLTDIPESITRLVNLTTLYLGNNKLTDIPDYIYELKSLKSLDFGNLSSGRYIKNQIKEISPKILQLENLRALRLDENPIETPPPEVVKEGIQAIKDYFRQIQAEGEDHLYEAKFLIVGEPGAGKTTLAKKIKDRNYKLRSDEGSTKGIDVITWNFKMESGQDFRVNIWDFGGQQIYHATHQFFLTKRSFYALVADIRKDDTDFHYWLSIVELLSDNSPLIIVKNEIQDRRREINERQLRGQFTNFREIFAANLATNRGLDEILRSVKFYISNLPHVGTQLPRTWVKVREALEKDNRNYISLDEYMEICKQNGFKQDKDKLQLSGYLHDIGVCLHFQDDMILRKTVILKPEWGTDAAYKVLDSEKVINNLGRFNHNDLVSIWSEKKYANMHAELLQLMLKFKLCYKIPGTNDTYIAPQLLTENQPEYEWDEKENLIFRYECSEFMPKGILSRFIVEMNRYITDENKVWKSGVILERDNTEAEVIENYGSREITIRVAGMQKKVLMSIITDALDMILDSFNRLKYKKLIPCNCSQCENSQEPYFHEYKILHKFDEDRQDKIQCLKSYEWVNVRKLIDDVLEKPEPEEYPEEQDKPFTDAIRILHLSDLHLTEDTDVPTILQPLVADLKSDTWHDFEKLGHRLDYIAISGDFANKAKKEGFEKAKEFVSQLIEEFGLSPERCILVPGNHDQSWDEEAYDWKQKRAVDKSKLKDGCYKEQNDGYLIRDDGKYPGRFSSFSELFYSPLFGSPYPTDFKDQAIIKFFDDTGILFLALNSSWEIDEYFPKRANIHEGALSRGLREVSKITEEHGTSILKIALWHHPVTDDDRIKNKDILEQLRVANFRLVLHGHVHEEKDELLYYTHSNSVHVIGTGTFGARMEDRPASTPFLYNLLEVSRDHSEVRVHTRCRHKDSGAWGPYSIHEGDKPGESKSYYTIPPKAL